MQDVSFSRAADIVKPWRRVLLLTHERPDGDALGCMVAIRALLAGQGIRATAYMFGAPPSRYRRFLERHPIDHWPGATVPALCDRYDGLIVADSCAWAQLEPARELLDARALPTLVVDHHITRDAIGDYLLSDSSASSAALIVGEWAEAAEWPLTPVSAEALFVGMATDTGWFRFSNCDGRTLRRAAGLLDHGVSGATLHQELYLADSPQRLHLAGAMIQAMTLHAGGRLAVCVITPELVSGCGANLGDVDDLVNESQRIGVVDTSVLLLERGDGPIKVSLRSKRCVDVAAIAARFGGGGHVRAAGARIHGPLEEVRARLIEAISAELEQSP